MKAFWIDKFKYLHKFLPFWLFLVLFKTGASFHYSLMSLFGERVLPVWIVGILIGLSSSIQLILDVPAGFLLDKYGYKKLLKVTTILFVISVVFLLAGLDKWTYLLTLFLSCFGWLFFGPGVNAYVLSHSPKDKPGEFIPFRDTFESIGVVLSSGLFIFLLLLPVQISAIVILFFLILSYVSLSFSPKDVYKVGEIEKIPTHNHYIKRQYLNKVIMAIGKLNPASLMLLLKNFSSAIFYAMVWFVVPLEIVKNESKFMALGLGVFDLAIVITGFWLGKLADKTNKKILVFLGLLIFSITAMFLGFNFGIMFLVLGFIATTGDELSSISLWLWLNTLDRKHDEDGLISGVINLFNDLGWTIGPMMAGVLYSTIGPEWTIAVGGMFIFVVWVIYSFVIGKQQNYFSLDSSMVYKKPHRFRHKR